MNVGRVVTRSDPPASAHTSPHSSTSRRSCSSCSTLSSCAASSNPSILSGDAWMPTSCPAQGGSEEPGEGEERGKRRVGAG